jgi:hypothetical protein
MLRNGKAVTHGHRRKLGAFFDPSLRIWRYSGRQVVSVGQERETFSYNKRTMDLAMRGRSFQAYALNRPSS